MPVNFTAKGIEELSLEQVAQAFVGSQIARYFPPNGSFDGRVFVGNIESVDTGIEDIDGTPLPGYQFLVKYPEDGDQEHLSTSVVMDTLQNSSRVRQKLRRVVDGDDEENGRMAEAPQRKRARTGRPPRPVDAEEPADADEAGPSRPPRPPQPSGTGTQRGRPRGAPTQPTQPTQGTQGVPNGGASISYEAVPYREDGTRGFGLPGHLKKIELIDFMCHCHFEMDFGPHVTFISGSNGSGKSATLQALQCALGVAARKTGRASTQKGFIREGADEATIRITLWNRPYAGKDAFQRETYGDTITVERRISRGSASHWALKDSTGRVVARRRDDLDAMLSVLGINAANPVTVMTQDTARSFLAASSAKAAQEMYNLYMECTQLGAIAENLADAQGRIRDMESFVSGIKEKYDTLEGNRDELKGKVVSLSKIEEYREEQEGVERALAWTLVGEEEGKVATLQAAAEAAPEEAEAAAAAVEALEKEVESLEEAVAGKRRFLETFDTAAGGALGAEKAAREEAKKAKKRANLLGQKVKRLEKRVEDAVAEKAELEEAREQAAADLVADARDVQGEYLRRLDTAQEAHRTAHEKLKALEADRNAAQAAETAAQRDCENQRKNLAGLRNDATRLDTQLRTLRSARQGTASSFGGAPMNNLVVTINKNAGRFHHRPIGPVGQYLELTDKQWGRAVESCLQNHGLHTFLVGDDHDCRILKEFIARCFGSSDLWSRPNICVLRMDLPVHTIPTNQQPPRDTATVLRVLRVRDAAVEAPIMNFLIDQQRVERMALAKNYEDGKRVVRQPMVLTVYEATGAKRYIRGQTESHDELHPNQLRQPVRLGASTREQADELELALNKAKDEATAAAAALRDAEEALAAAKSAHEKARQVLVAHRPAVQETETTLEDVQSQAPAEVLATQMETRDGDGEGGGGGALANEIIDATQKIIDLERELENVRGELETAQEEDKSAAAALAAAEEAHKRLKEENADHVSGFDHATKTLVAKRGQLEKKRAEADASAAERSRAEADLTAAQKLAADMAGVAEEVCTREEGAAAVAVIAAAVAAKARGEAPTVTKMYLERKSEHLAKKVTEMECQAGGSLADLESQLAAAQAALDGEGARQKAVLGLYKHLVDSYRRREKKFKEVDVAVSEDVQHRFNHYMRRKNHLGKIKIDRAERRLSLTVTIGERGQQGGGRVNDLKQLSGGERSYTTVAFTLALGSTTEMPFRAMDEFDVFMDSVNRRVAMENLLQFAHEQPDLQFVFLTPQDMAAVDEAKAGAQRLVKREIPEDFVKIVQMKPARPAGAAAVGAARR